MLATTTLALALIAAEEKEQAELKLISDFRSQLLRKKRKEGDGAEG